MTRWSNNVICCDVNMYECIHGWAPIDQVDRCVHGHECTDIDGYCTLLQPAVAATRKIFYGDGNYESTENKDLLLLISE